MFFYLFLIETHISDVWSSDVFDNNFLLFADRVVLVRRENRDPLELLASRFGSPHSAETL